MYVVSNQIHSEVEIIPLYNNQREKYIKVAKQAG